MRKLFASLFVAGLAVIATAQEKGEGKQTEPKKVAPKDAVKKKAEVTLKVGDAPPKLRVDKWIQGQEVKSFEKGKVYIVELWTTWCGPCITMMPHLGELQRDYRKQGVTIVGLSQPDGRNTEKQVADFVKKNGPRLGYTFAYSEEENIFKNEWLTRAGINGIPCCFVIDKDTRIAYIGHPMFLDDVLPKVVDGTWKIEDAAETVKAIQAAYGDLSKAMRNEDAEEGLKEVAAIDKKHPGFASVPYQIGSRFLLMLRAKKYDDVKTMAKKLMDKAKKTEDTSMLAQISSILRSPTAKSQQDLVSLSIEAAELGVKITDGKDIAALLSLGQAYAGVDKKDKVKETMENAEALIKSQSMEKDVNTMLRMSQAYYTVLGDKEKGEEYGKKAVAAAPEAQKEQVENIVKRFAQPMPMKQ